MGGAGVGGGVARREVVRRGVVTERGVVTIGVVIRGVVTEGGVAKERGRGLKGWGLGVGPGGADRSGRSERGGVRARP